LGDQGFDQIFKSCKKLRFISVYDCSLTDHSMGLIKLMTDLIFIELGENPNISEDKIQELKERIENNDLKNRPTKSGLGFWGTSDSTVAKQSDGQCIFEL